MHDIPSMAIIEVFGTQFINPLKVEQT